MNCGCDRSLSEDILSLLQLMRTELSEVRIKCHRIEKELFGINSSDPANSEAVMENTTVRQVLEKIEYQTEWLKRRKEAAEEKEEKELRKREEEDQRKLIEAMTRKLEEDDQWNKHIEETENKKEEDQNRNGLAYIKWKEEEEEEEKDQGKHMGNIERKDEESKMQEGTETKFHSAVSSLKEKSQGKTKPLDRETLQKDATRARLKAHNSVDMPIWLDDPKLVKNKDFRKSRIAEWLHPKRSLPDNTFNLFTRTHEEAQDFITRLLLTQVQGKSSNNSMVASVNYSGAGDVMAESLGQDLPNCSSVMDSLARGVDGMEIDYSLNASAVKSHPEKRVNEEFRTPYGSNEDISDQNSK